ncbi:MAG: GNAT family N-acetyltransferase, partial [Gemmatimonadetes bacterium]|nr:GNAT family N-acetyltransferase [Gemmatimonadota bacterium]
MSGLRISVEVDPAPADAETLRAGLLAFNVVHSGDPGLRDLAVFLRDAEGRVVGGLLGQVKWEWLYVEKFWLPEALRGAGWGSRLLRAAEDFARENGCRAVYLDTLEYQARPFYERHGYELFGVLEDYPPGF